MRLWIPVTMGGLIVLAYAAMYEITLAESQGATSLELANSIGLVAVIVGLVAAAFLMRRASPRQ